MVDGLSICLAVGGWNFGENIAVNVKDNSLSLVGFKDDGGSIVKFKDGGRYIVRFKDGGRSSVSGGRMVLAG